MTGYGKANRRDFIAGVAAAALSQTVRANAQAPTIQEVIDRIIKDTTGTPLKQTIDTFKAGDPSRRVTGIATTFLATFEVIKKASEMGANLLITHEPTFYEHADNVDSLLGDPVYDAKKKLIQETRITIWRFHDYWHSHQPDGIIRGLARRLDLKQINPDNKRLYEMSPITFEELCNKCKERLQIPRVMAVGDPGMICRRVGLFAGWGGAMGPQQIELLSKKGMDVVICGETAEWTSCEYARDATAARLNKGLIVLGHAHSEEPGMEDAADWLRERFPSVKTFHVRAATPFRFV
ncbi:MAG: Nif3-like dinuclear metal center hexameric protein [Acidobacteriota bacterium]